MRYRLNLLSTQSAVIEIWVIEIISACLNFWSRKDTRSISRYAWTWRKTLPCLLIAGTFYEYELHRDSSGYIPRRKNIAQEGKGGLRKVAEIRWIAQFMDTQEQCVVKIKICYKIIINLLYTFFHTKIETLLYKHTIRI